MLKRKKMENTKMKYAKMNRCKKEKHTKMQKKCESEEIRVQKMQKKRENEKKKKKKQSAKCKNA